MHTQVYGRVGRDQVGHARAKQKHVKRVHERPRAFRPRKQAGQEIARDQTQKDVEHGVAGHVEFRDELVDGRVVVDLHRVDVDPVEGEQSGQRQQQLPERAGVALRFHAASFRARQNRQNAIRKQRLATSTIQNTDQSA